MAEGETFGELLRRVRIERGQTQHEVAAEIGVNSMTCGRWELGALPKLRQFYPVLDYLEMSAEDVRPYVQRTLCRLGHTTTDLDPPADEPRAK